MGRTSAVIGSTVFFVLAPGVVALLLPWLIGQWPVEPAWRNVPVLFWTGAALELIGLAALIECFARFALQGLGTPAPVAPTKHLVVTGLYRHVRNPMYVAVMAIILAQALLFASWPILIYAALVWLAFTAFVVAYEEPTLQRAFGKEYDAYRANVGRWLPRLSPWRPQV